MKTLYINNLYKPYAVGGAERVIEDLVKPEDVVISWRPWSGFGCWKPERSAEEGVVIYRYWVPNIFSYKNLNKHNFVLKLIWHKIDIWNCWSGRIVKKILKEEKPDVVNTHNLMGMGFSIPKVIQKLGIKHIHTLHDVQLVEPSGVLFWDHEKDDLIQKIYSWVMKRRFGRPDEIVCLSKFLMEFYKKRGFFEIGNWKGTSHPELSEGSYCVSNVANSSGSFGLRPQDDIITHFLFVGSLVEHKGIGVLIKVWKKLPDDFHAELHIVGSGKLLDKVIEWSKKNNKIKVYCRLEKEELNKIYEKCDVLVFPSVCIENRPNVLIEAMQHGLSIIASDTGGVQELINGYKKAQLVEPGNVESLKKSILDL